MPLETFKLHVNDQPWVTPEVNNLIKLYNLYRNRVNRERKSCRARFYSSKVQQL